MRRASAPAALLALLAMGCSCGASERTILVDLHTDLRAGVELVRVRVEHGDQPFTGGGSVTTAPIHEADASADYIGGVRVAQLLVAHCERVHLRVTVLDAAGRLRGQRVAEVPAGCDARAVRVNLSRACAGVRCGDGEACAMGVCVPATCDDAGVCGGACDDDGACPAPTEPCLSAACTEAGCLARDTCGADAYCAAGACAPRPRCGDGACDPATETPCRCPEDCAAPACPATCGDGACDGEDSASCPEDCGPPPPVCGDAICEVDEDCPSDCVSDGGPVCGDASCDPGEGCADCAECCVSCEGPECEGCGDGTCGLDEGCPMDCGPVSECGDARCDAGEDCPGDCVAGAGRCGDGTCEDGMGESCLICQRDCGWCGGFPEIPALTSCRGEPARSGEAVCGDLDGAFTSAAVNLAYYPMLVSAPSTDLVSGEGRVLRALPNLARFHVQSTRNPTCLDRPPLRPAIDGWVFGYAQEGAGLEDRVGWVQVDDLILDGLREGEPCANGPEGEDFQVSANPYARSPRCAPIGCEGAPPRCIEANPVDEDAGECGGALVDRDATVEAATLWLRYSAGGAPRRILHTGDELRVRYDDGGGWLYVTVTSSATPLLSPVGATGWVQASSTR